jgi:hypothetical protein
VKQEGPRIQAYVDLWIHEPTWRFDQAVVGMGVKNFKVMDSCSTTTCSPTRTANTVARLADLRNGTEKDVIHFMQTGYQNLADSDRCTACIRSLLDDSKKEEKLSTLFWRGFKGTWGSKRVTVHRQHLTRGRGTPYISRGASSRGRIMHKCFHPYRRN